jgi:hypothetical protein
LDSNAVCLPHPRGAFREKRLLGSTPGGWTWITGGKRELNSPGLFPN